MSSFCFNENLALGTGFSEYVASSDGYIFHKEIDSLIIVKPSIRRCNGECEVYLKDDNGRKRTMLVKSIIAKLFVENPRNYRCVGHRDGDKTNNSASNLFYYNQSGKGCSTSDPVKSDVPNVLTPGVFKMELNDYMMIFKRVQRFKGNHLGNDCWMLPEISLKVRPCKVHPYYISMQGFLFRFNRKTKEFIFEPWGFDKYGYPALCVKKADKLYAYRISRMVGEAWVNNDDPVHKKFVLHRDGNGMNNDASNLYWSASSVAPKRVRCFKRGKHGKYGLEFESITAAAKYFKCSVNNISLACHGKYFKSHYYLGMYWDFA